MGILLLSFKPSKILRWFNHLKLYLRAAAALYNIAIMHIHTRNNGEYYGICLILYGKIFV